jgi:uncharacterized protein (DUF488 family)
MCAEKDPDRCHRRHLISRALTERGVAVLHILADKVMVRERDMKTPHREQP